MTNKILASKYKYIHPPGDGKAATGEDIPCLVGAIAHARQGMLFYSVQQEN